MLESNIDSQKVETLIEINSLINSDYSDAQAVLQRIVESAMRLTDSQASSLLLLHPENNRLYFEIALGSKGAEVKRFSLALGEGIAGWVAQHNRSLIVNDVETDERFFADISKQIGFPTHAILAVPMRIKDRCTGVLEMINKNDGKPFNDADRQWLEIFANQGALAIQNARNFEKARDEIYSLQSQIESEQGYHTLIAESPVMEEKLALVDRIARSNSSVLILGESGVGKELFAEQIHLRSDRRNEPLIRVNCAALPEGLLESELFGHVRGAFTDAVQDRRGRFELADGGSIFLDEIGEIPLGVQAKLLRVLQEQTFEPLGSSRQIRVNVRIVAATNKDIEEAVDQGSFRRDLFYRLNVLPIYIPPLRERPEDIRALADHFLKKSVRDIKKLVRGFSDEAMEELLSYTWPGNVRELQNAVERAVVMTRRELIHPEDLILQPNRKVRADRYANRSLKESVNIFKKQFIRTTLEHHGWNQTHAAKALGIQRTYLSRLIKELNISH